MTAAPPTRPWGPLLRAALYGVGLAALGAVSLHGLPYPDHPLDLFGEYGRLEWIQVVLLVVSLALCVLTAVRRPASRPISVLLVGGLVAVLVREHNNAFKDHGFSGLWELIVAAVLVATVLVARRWRSAFVPALSRYVALPAFGWMCAAVLLAAFAQLVDEQSLWDFVLEGAYVPYAARRVAEETLELAAFYLLAAGLLEAHLGFPTDPPGEPPGSVDSPRIP